MHNTVLVNICRADSPFFIEGKELDLSTDPVKKVHQISAFLEKYSRYTDGERGAVKALLPRKIRVSLSKTKDEEIPFAPSAMKVMNWTLSAGKTFFERDHRGNHQICVCKIVHF